MGIENEGSHAATKHLDRRSQVQQTPLMRGVHQYFLIPFRSGVKCHMALELIMASHNLEKIKKNFITLRLKVTVLFRTEREKEFAAFIAYDPS